MNTHYSDHPEEEGISLEEEEPPSPILSSIMIQEQETRWNLEVMIMMMRSDIWSRRRC